jgi:serine/threonine protein kinase
MSDPPTNPEEERYVIVKPVGFGGMANIYLARDTVLERKVVLKEVREELAHNDDFAAMFLDEARVIASLNHPNIVRIYDVGLRNDVPFMALEWLEGWDLRMVEEELDARGQRLDLGVILRLVADAAHGLEAAHTAKNDQGVPLRLVHRDVSPHNLFVTVGGVLKLLDFGIAKSSVQTGTTGDHVIKGKFAYMAPEQLQGQAVDRRCDVFALGINLHELLSGQPLFGGLSLPDVYEAILVQPIPPPSRPDQELPDEVVNITMQALARDLTARWASAGALADALEAVMHQHGFVRGPDDIATTLTRLFAGTGQHVLERRSTVAIGRLDDQSSPAASASAAEPSAWAGARGGKVVPTATISIESLLGAPEPTHEQRRLRDLVRGYSQNLVLAFVVLCVGGGLLFAALHIIPKPPPKGVVETPSKAAAGAEEPARRSSRVRAVGGTGRLTLDTEPMTDVYLGDQGLGSTPLTAIPLPAGTAKLRLVSRRAAIDETITVTIQPGVTLRRHIDLTRPSRVRGND